MERNNRRAAVYVFWLLILSGMIQIYLVALIPNVKDKLDLEKNLFNLQNKRELIKANIDKLLDEKRALLLDPYYNEYLARKDLNLMKPGEREYPRVIINNNKDTRTPKMSFATAYAIPSNFLFLANDTPKRIFTVILGFIQIVTAFVIAVRNRA